MRKLAKVVKLIEEYEENGKRLSEIDTQILLVEPVLCHAGYDIFNPYIVKRASRSPQSQEFDIEVYKNGNLFLAIEVKSFNSSEFNIRKFNAGNRIGALSKQNQQYENSKEDGVGQLRAYCLNWNNNKISVNVIPILTNGKEWVLFNMRLFRKKPTCPINREMIRDQAEVTDENFYEKIIKKIKNT